MRSHARPDRPARLVVALTAAVARRPRAVLAAVGLVTVAAAVAAANRLEYHTQRNDLLAADKPCQQRWQRYLDAFGDDDDMIVVAEGTDPQALRAALDDVAGRLRCRSDLFDRVFHRVDLAPLRDRALLYLSPEELEELAARLEGMGPLLSLEGGLAWRLVSLQTLLGHAAGVLAACEAGREPTATGQVWLATLPPLLASAAAALRDPHDYHSPWTLGPTPAGPAAADLATPRYFFTPDGTLALLLCRPRKAARSFTPAKQANAALRAILAEVGPCHPGVTLGLTGLPVLETDEMELSGADTARAAVLALAGVAVLYGLAYRGPRYPLLTLTTLAIGTVWALGWAALTVGHLNILSAAFAVMLIGLGDYGVLWVARYDAARGEGEPVVHAVLTAGRDAGPSILTAAATTALAFFAVMLADFQAVAELGWIAGCGILCCAASCLLLLPALLPLVDRRPVTTRATAVAPGEPNRRPAFTTRPRLILTAAAVLVLLAAASATRLTYDHNLLNLQSPDLESVAWERKLVERSAGATWDALSLARDRDEALALRARYQAVPEVAAVVEVASLIPADQERKLPVVRAIQERLRAVPPPDQLPPPLGSDPAAVREVIGRLARLAGAGEPLTRALADLTAALDSAPDLAGRLHDLDRRLAADLAARLQELKAVCRPEPITVADLPVELRERYVGAKGEFLVRAFARDSLWDYEALQRFTEAATAVDPEATGKAFRTLEGLRQMRHGFERAAGYALLAILVVLVLDLRRPVPVLLAVFPLAVGMVLTFGVLAAAGVSLNPANLIAVPLIFGVGVDNGVHVLHDYQNRRPGGPYRLGTATGRGILVAGLTTILGFGTLMTARHAGLASLGLTLALGVSFCMAAALIVLPAVLGLLARPTTGDGPSAQRPIVVRGLLPVPLGVGR